MSEKRRILFFSHYFPPEGNAPASRVYETCRRWARDGHQVTVITCAPNVPNGKVYDGYRNRLFQSEEMDGLTVHRVWTFIAPNRGFLLRVANYLSYLFSATLRSIFVSRPDVIIATSPQFFCGWAGVFAKWLKRRPLVLEIRDIWPDSIRAVGAVKNEAIMRALEWLEHRMYSAADHIVTVGDGYRSCLEAKGVAADRISVVANGVDYDRFHSNQDASALRRSLGLENRFICAYVGTIGMASGLEVVLRAGEQARQSPDAPVYVLVGDGALRDRLQAEAKRKNLDEIVFTGRVDKTDVPTYITMADCILVHLKKAELFTTVLPSKMFEAMAIGRPIVLGVEGEAANLLEQAGAGLAIEPENETDLLAAIQNLRENPGIAADMSAAGRQFIRQYHDREQLSRDYLEIVCRICGTERAEKPKKTVASR